MLECGRYSTPDLCGNPLIRSHSFPMVEGSHSSWMTPTSVCLDPGFTVVRLLR